MRLILYKQVNGKNIVKVQRTFTDAVELQQFLADQGLALPLSDCISDIEMDSVTYTVPLLEQQYER